MTDLHVLTLIKYDFKIIYFSLDHKSYLIIKICV